MDFTTDNKSTRTSLKEFEKDLLKEGLLRLKPFMKKDLKGVSVKDFIIKFIKTYNKDNALQNVDIESEEVTCAQNKMRAGGDIFRISKYYYPKTTLLEVLAVLDELATSPKKEWKSQICGQIKKRVIIDVEPGTGTLYHSEKKDEFNRQPGEYVKEWNEEKSKKSSTQKEWTTAGNYY